MQLRQYQEAALSTDQTRPSPGAEPSLNELAVPLLGLAGETGQLLAEYKKHLRDGADYPLLIDRVSEELGDLLWYVATSADRFGLHLEDIAIQNLKKCAERWPGSAPAPRYFDARFPANQQLPRQMEVQIGLNPQRKVRMRVNGKQTGDPLTDNAYSPDGYGFHDVLHLAHVAVLDWSPVIRKLAKRKRKSDKVVDEVEDGGRAIAIEEGIAALVFDYARQHDYLKGAHRLSWDLLRTVKSLTEHLEVRECTIAEWEIAIQLGFQVWNQVVAHKGGTIFVDVDVRAMRFEPPEKSGALFARRNNAGERRGVRMADADQPFTDTERAGDFGGHT